MNKTVHLGSGYVYLKPYDGTIPEDLTELETPLNNIGFVKNGCTLSYKTNVPVYGDTLTGDLHTVIVGEEVTVKFGLMTWDSEVLEKLSFTTELTQTATKNTLKLGGLKHTEMKRFLVHFVSFDKKNRVTIVGSNTAGFDVAFLQNKESIVNCSFRAIPMEDGHLLIYTETTEEVEPKTLEIKVNGTFDCSDYYKVKVNIPEGGPDFTNVTAIPSVVLPGYNFYNTTGDLVPGSMEVEETYPVNYSSTSGSNFVFNSSNANVVAINNTTSFLVPAAGFGNATPSQVMEGYSFTSNDGYNKEGALENWYGRNPTVHYRETTTQFYKFNMWVDNKLAVDRTTNAQIYRTDFGNAAAANVDKGVYFTSSEGFNIEGTKEPLNHYTGEFTAASHDLTLSFLNYRDLAMFRLEAYTSNTRFFSFDMDGYSQTISSAIRANSSGNICVQYKYDDMPTRSAQPNATGWSLSEDNIQFTLLGPTWSGYYPITYNITYVFK